MSTEEVAGSSGIGEEIPEESMYSDKSKSRLKDAVVYYEELLTENNLIASTPSEEISHDAMLLAGELYNNTLELLGEKKFVIEEELIHAHEDCEELQFEVPQLDSSPDEYEPEPKKNKSEMIPIAYKVKVVNIAKAHPTWSLATLQKKGCSRLKRKEYLSQWENDIKSGGTRLDKFEAIDSWTYDRFVETRQQYQQVTTRNLQQWALAAAAQFIDFNFKASDRWVTAFKQKHKISQRKITKLVSKKEAASMEEILASAETFRRQTCRLIPQYHEDYVINTDQTGKYKFSAYKMFLPMQNV